MRFLGKLPKTSENRWKNSRPPLAPFQGIPFHSDLFKIYYLMEDSHVQKLF